MKFNLKSGILLTVQLLGLGISLFICNLLSSTVVVVNLGLPPVPAELAAKVALAWLIPLVQLGRGFIWTGLAVLVIKLMKGKWWESGLAVSLLFAVLTSSGLLLPYNPIMPKAVAAVHFRELFSSNFIFGALTVWVLNRGGKNRPDGIGSERAV